MARSIEEQLFDPELACGFDPFQAVRVLELLANDPPAGGLRDCLGLFTVGLAALWYRAWQKYRRPAGHLRTVWRPRRDGPAGDRRPPDKLTRVLLSVVGLGVPGLRDRLKVEAPGAAGGPL